MTVHDLYLWMAESWSLVAVAAALWPAAVLFVSAGLRLTGARDGSQQVANAGIAVGLVALLVEGLALVYAVRMAGADPIASAPVALLAVPPWLAVSGFAVEHVVHPGKQETFRRPVRIALQAAVALGVLGAVFSVLRIHMLVFSGMYGFLVFVGALIAVFWFLIRRLV